MNLAFVVSSYRGSRPAARGNYQCVGEKASLWKEGSGGPPPPPTPDLPPHGCIHVYTISVEETWAAKWAPQPSAQSEATAGRMVFRPKLLDSES
ncbi:hypothetical protein PHLCEN_2v11128 [Hermanssonia centrifuga]|uniref:Uncharacterized protein n=1 Tax=Hermanssonia centrifuga TaxID=98765 RepID=A0A2R6NKX1_9APHY|nr:hypothetical protein PHLCEN_2v11128 [Hermanssonia centrifuga]